MLRGNIKISLLFWVGWPRICLLFLVVGLSACSAGKQPDYTRYYDRMPKSILVVAPLNETAAIEATDRFMSTITAAVAEQGYYVFPLVLVDQMFKENGVVSPIEIRQVSASKLYEIFGADALLNISIRSWGTSYSVIHSSTEVTLDYQLIDLASGELLWSGSGRAVDSAQGSGGLGDIAAQALIHALASTMTDKEVELARQANYSALHNRRSGLLLGPRRPQTDK